MTSTQRLPRTISKKLDRDNEKTGTFQREIFNCFSTNATDQGLVITLGRIDYSNGST